LLHSFPGAKKTIFLNFNGGEIDSSAWATNKLEALPYDTDGKAGFGAAEQLSIFRIWQRVSEDYYAWNVDVTTELPAVTPASNRDVGRVFITRGTDAIGTAMPSNSGGGVAFINVFGQANYP
jgi:hypothetical protein